MAKRKPRTNDPATGRRPSFSPTEMLTPSERQSLLEDSLRSHEIATELFRRLWADRLKARTE